MPSFSFVALFTADVVPLVLGSVGLVGSVGSVGVVGSVGSVGVVGSVPPIGFRESDRKVTVRSYHISFFALWEEMTMGASSWVTGSV